MSRTSISNRYQEHSSRSNNSARPASQRPESVRDILVPCHNLKAYSVVLKPPQFRRVKTASRIITNEERQRQADKREAERCRLEKESENRKQFLQGIDRIRDEKLGRNRDPFGEEKAEQEAKMLDRAFLAKQEQEDEVKRANQIILAKKVYLVQDAQMQEKRDLEQKVRAEELRLEKLILERDAKALEEQKERSKDVKQRREQYANDLKKSVEHQEVKKMLDAERIENEAKHIALAQAELKRSEAALVKAKRERYKRNQKELQETIEMAEYFRKIAEEEKREAEMKAQEFQRQRADREKQMVVDKRLQREQRQREIDRILLQQTRKLQTAERAETMAMRRIQEEKEREFREKAKASASKRISIQNHLLEARGLQIEEMKRLKERQRQLEAVERQKYTNLLKEAEELEKVERQKSIVAKEKYRKDIIAQIEQRMQRDRSMKSNGRQENSDRQKQEEKRQQNIRDVIASKINEMRTAKIPESIVRDVERQLDLSIK